MVPPELQRVPSLFPSRVKAREALGGEQAVRTMDGYGILLDAQLHVDEDPDEKNLRVTVYEKVGAILLPAMKHKNANGKAEIWFPYAPDHFRVLTANGEDTVSWSVLQVKSRYEDLLDGVVNAYRAERERLTLMLQNEVGVQALMEFRRSGEGLIRAESLGAWVLPVSDIVPPNLSAAA